MAERPKTQYATSGDLQIGYQVFGQGPVDLAFVSGLLWAIDSLWDFPAAARFLRRLGSFSRVIIYDKRGQGVSDRAPGVPSLDDDMEDLTAVLDAADAEQVAMFAYSEGGPMSALYAATHPDRVSSLTLLGSYPSGRVLTEEGDRLGLNPVARVTDALEHWGEGRGLELFAPSVYSEQTAPYFGSFERAVGSPAAVRSRWGTAIQLDVTPVLSTLRLPTLVMHRSGDRAVPASAGREFAAAIPDARYLELEGDDHIPWVGDADTILDEIEESVTGARHAHDIDRAVATVMFTDIVGSTSRAAELGDGHWRELLEAHDDVVRRQLEHYRGREVKSVGDGFLATFDGPARGIRCAESIVRRVRSLGIEVRAGLHTGECELIGDDVGGIAVHIGARVGSLAEGGEVLVSRTVEDLVVGSGIEFEDRGTHDLKGVPGEWRIAAVAPAPAG